MSYINPDYELPPPDTVEVDCETLEVSGHIRSPTITQIQKSINDHVNNGSVHRSVKVLTLTTDGISDSYVVTHHFGTVSLQITFFDVTTVPQQLLFVHWEPISENAIRIVPGVRFDAGRIIKIIFQ